MHKSLEKGKACGVDCLAAEHFICAHSISHVYLSVLFKGECSVILYIFLLWMETMHYPNAIRSHLVTIVPMTPFTPKFTSKFRSALHIRYSKVIPRFISRANTAQS